MMWNIAWVVTRLGYLYCATCAAEREIIGKPIRVGDLDPGSDCCDVCGTLMRTSPCGEVLAPIARGS